MFSIMLFVCCLFVYIYIVISDILYIREINIKEKEDKDYNFFEKMNKKEGD